MHLGFIVFELACFGTSRACNERLCAAPTHDAQADNGLPIRTFNLNRDLTPNILQNF